MINIKIFLNKETPNPQHLNKRIILELEEVDMMEILVKLLSLERMDLKFFYNQE
jgi:hypothetical protein